MFTAVICVALLSLATGVTRRIKIPDGLTVHKVIGTWDEADELCKREGAVLASPINAELLDAMRTVIGINKIQYLIGAKYTHYPGPFISVEGIPLESMTAAVMEMVEQLDPRDGSCLSMDRHNIRVVPCCTRLPFMCYKTKTKENQITSDANEQNIVMKNSKHSTKMKYIDNEAMVSTMSGGQQAITTIEPVYSAMMPNVVVNTVADRELQSTTIESKNAVTLPNVLEKLTMETKAIPENNDTTIESKYTEMIQDYRLNKTTTKTVSATEKEDIIGEPKYSATPRATKYEPILNIILKIELKVDSSKPENAITMQNAKNKTFVNIVVSNTDQAAEFEQSKVTVRTQNIKNATVTNTVADIEHNITTSDSNNNITTHNSAIGNNKETITVPEQEVTTDAHKSTVTTDHEAFVAPGAIIDIDNTAGKLIQNETAKNSKYQFLVHIVPDIEHLTTDVSKPHVTTPNINGTVVENTIAEAEYNVTVDEPKYVITTQTTKSDTIVTTLTVEDKTNTTNEAQHYKMVQNNKSESTITIVTAVNDILIEKPGYANATEDIKIESDLNTVADFEEVVTTDEPDNNVTTQSTQNVTIMEIATTVEQENITDEPEHYVTVIEPFVNTEDENHCQLIFRLACSNNKNKTNSSTIVGNKDLETTTEDSKYTVITQNSKNDADCNEDCTLSKENSKIDSVTVIEQMFTVEKSNDATFTQTTITDFDRDITTRRPKYAETTQYTNIQADVNMVAADEQERTTEEIKHALMAQGTNNGSLINTSQEFTTEKLEHDITTQHTKNVTVLDNIEILDYEVTRNEEIYDVTMQIEKHKFDVEQEVTTDVLEYTETVPGSKNESFLETEATLEHTNNTEDEKHRVPTKNRKNMTIVFVIEQAITEEPKDDMVAENTVNETSLGNITTIDHEFTRNDDIDNVTMETEIYKSNVESVTIKKQEISTDDPNHKVPTQISKTYSAINVIPDIKQEVTTIIPKHNVTVQKIKTEPIIEIGSFMEQQNNTKDAKYSLMKKNTKNKTIVFILAEEENRTDESKYDVTENTKKYTNLGNITIIDHEFTRYETKHDIMTQTDTHESTMQSVTTTEPTTEEVKLAVTTQRFEYEPVVNKVADIKQALPTDELKDKVIMQSTENEVTMNIEEDLEQNLSTIIPNDVTRKEIQTTAFMEMGPFVEQKNNTEDAPHSLMKKNTKNKTIVFILAEEENNTDESKYNVTENTKKYTNLGNITIIDHEFTRYETKHDIMTQTDTHESAMQSVTTTEPTTEEVKLAVTTQKFEYEPVVNKVADIKQALPTDELKDKVIMQSTENEVTMNIEEDLEQNLSTIIPNDVTAKEIQTTAFMEIGPFMEQKNNTEDAQHSLMKKNTKNKAIVFILAEEENNTDGSTYEVTGNTINDTNLGNITIIDHEFTRYEMKHDIMTQTDSHKSTMQSVTSIEPTTEEVKLSVTTQKLEYEPVVNKVADINQALTTDELKDKVFIVAEQESNTHEAEDDVPENTKHDNFLDSVVIIDHEFTTGEPKNNVTTIVEKHESSMDTVTATEQNVISKETKYDVMTQTSKYDAVSNKVTNKQIGTTEELIYKVMMQSTQYEDTVNKSADIEHVIFTNAPKLDVTAQEINYESTVEIGAYIGQINYTDYPKHNLTTENIKPKAIVFIVAEQGSTTHKPNTENTKTDTVLGNIIISDHEFTTDEMEHNITTGVEIHESSVQAVTVMERNDTFTTKEVNTVATTQKSEYEPVPNKVDDTKQRFTTDKPSQKYEMLTQSTENETTMNIEADIKQDAKHSATKKNKKNKTYVFIVADIDTEFTKNEPEHDTKMQYTKSKSYEAPHSIIGKNDIYEPKHNVATQSTNNEAGWETSAFIEQANKTKNEDIVMTVADLEQEIITKAPIYNLTILKTVPIIDQELIKNDASQNETTYIQSNPPTLRTKQAIEQDVTLKELRDVTTHKSQHEPGWNKVAKKYQADIGDKPKHDVISQNTKHEAFVEKFTITDQEMTTYEVRYNLTTQTERQETISQTVRALEQDVILKESKGVVTMQKSIYVPSLNIDNNKQITTTDYPRNDLITQNTNHETFVENIAMADQEFTRSEVNVTPQIVTHESIFQTVINVEEDVTNDELSDIMTTHKENHETFEYMVANTDETVSTNEQAHEITTQNTNSWTISEPLTRIDQEFTKEEANHSITSQTETQKSIVQSVTTIEQDVSSAELNRTMTIQKTNQDTFGKKVANKEENVFTDELGSYYITTQNTISRAMPETLTLIDQEFTRGEAKHSDTLQIETLKSNVESVTTMEKVVSTVAKHKDLDYTVAKTEVKNTTEEPEHVFMTQNTNRETNSETLTLIDQGFTRDEVKHSVIPRNETLKSLEKSLTIMKQDDTIKKLNHTMTTQKAKQEVVGNLVANTKQTVSSYDSRFNVTAQNTNNETILETLTHIDQELIKDKAKYTVAPQIETHVSIVKTVTATEQNVSLNELNHTTTTQKPNHEAVVNIVANTEDKVITTELIHDVMTQITNNDAVEQIIIGKDKKNSTDGLKRDIIKNNKKIKYKILFETITDIEPDFTKHNVTIQNKKNDFAVKTDAVTENIEEVNSSMTTQGNKYDTVLNEADNTEQKVTIDKLKYDVTTQNKKIDSTVKIEAIIEQETITENEKPTTTTLKTNIESVLTNTEPTHVATVQSIKDGAAINIMEDTSDYTPTIYKSKYHVTTQNTNNESVKVTTAVSKQEMTAGKSSYAPVTIIEQEATTNMPKQSSITGNAKSKSIVQNITVTDHEDTTDEPKYDTATQNMKHQVIVQTSEVIKNENTTIVPKHIASMLNTKNNIITIKAEEITSTKPKYLSIEQNTKEDTIKVTKAIVEQKTTTQEPRNTTAMQNTSNKVFVETEANTELEATTEKIKYLVTPQNIEEETVAATATVEQEVITGTPTLVALTQKTNNVFVIPGIEQESATQVSKYISTTKNTKNKTVVETVTVIGHQLSTNMPVHAVNKQNSSHESTVTVPLVKHVITTDKAKHNVTMLTTEHKVTTDSIEKYKNCSKDYRFYKSTGSCYKKHKRARKWDDAQTTCEAEHGHLLVIDDKEESLAIKDLSLNDLDPFAFVGLRNYEDNGWMSVTGKRREDVFNKWYFGQPKDDAMKCGVIYPSGILDNLFCHVAKTFICEQEIKRPPEKQP